MSLSNYPEKFDNNQNLYLVHDYLRLKLASDYTPGDTTIYVTGSKSVMSAFPNAAQGGGVITLTDQCDDVLNRSISFKYSSRTTNDMLDLTNPWEFNGIKILDNFNNVKKYKDITNVCQNVIAEHHNSLKDALINIQGFAGIKGKVATAPYQGTVEERVNYLRKIVLGPRAWFSASKTVAQSSSTIFFNDLSFSLGTDGVGKKTKYTWYFDLQKTDLGYEFNSDDQNDILIYEKLSTDKKEIKHTYENPGSYNVGLIVENEFGSDFVVFENMINIRDKAPDEANIIVSDQTIKIFNGSYRVPVGYVIPLQVQTPGISNPSVIDSYTWSIVDDLNHFNNSSTKCSFSVGGIYDVGLRVDTKFGNYRITIFEDILDVVEKTNLWLWNINNEKNSITNYEFGLISETFKTLSSYPIQKIDDSFIKNRCEVSKYYYDELCRQRREFNRNNGFCKKNNTSSGDSGEGLIYWASGRTSSMSPSEEKIHIRKFSGFTQTYSSVSLSGKSYVNRPWNWVGLGSSYNLYFCFGNSEQKNSQDTNPSITKLNLNNLSKSEFQIADSQYLGGSQELKLNSICEGWDIAGEDPIDCQFASQENREYYSVYRSAWKDNTGYIIRNEGSGLYFKFRPFYKTSGTTTNEITSIKKLTDMTGPVKSEGELVTLSDGVFMFNNTGSIAAYNTTTETWAIGGPGTNSSEFRFLQDINKDKFDNYSQSLLATSDNDQNVYLSYDYSEKSFIKFNNVDLTFKYVGVRPSGEQWQLKCY